MTVSQWVSLFWCRIKGNKVEHKTWGRLRVYWLIQNCPMSSLGSRNIFFSLNIQMSCSMSKKKIKNKKKMKSHLLCVFNLYLLLPYCPITPVSWVLAVKHTTTNKLLWSGVHAGQPARMHGHQSRNQFDVEVFLRIFWQWDTNLSLPSFSKLCWSFIIFQGSTPVTNVVETG